MKVDEDALLRNIKSLVDAENDEEFDKAFEKLEHVDMVPSDKSLEGSK